jgi:poly(3-hydroxybutyrate) depolymerase
MQAGASSTSNGSASASSGSGPITDAGAAGGCGQASLPTPDSIPDGGGFGGSTLPLQRFTLDVGGVSREFILGLPDKYNPQQKYPVVFAWHGAGGTDVQVAWGGTSSFDTFGGYYGLRYLSTQASKPMIFVAGQGLSANDAGSGWPNTNGQDVALTQAMVTWLESNYCVDEARIFSVGMSYGGIMTNTVGCKLGSTFRAIAPMSGIGPGFGFGSPGCVGQVAAWVAHGSQDPMIAVEAGMATRDYWAQANHCSAATVDASPFPCVAYQGCDPGYPVDWCEFDGGHTVVSFEPPGIWSFLQQF